jgi:hypothetical protein
MKTLYVVAFGLLALIPAVSGTAVPAKVVTSANAVLQASNAQSELLQVLKAQAAAGGTLSRPL